MKAEKDARSQMTDCRHRARAAAKRIALWADFQQEPWGRLLMAVVSLAIEDLGNESQRQSALRWVRECVDNPIVTALGLDGAAIQRLVKQAGLLDEAPGKMAA